MKPTILAACAAALMTGQAAAQVPCGPRDTLVEALTEKYGERPQAVAMDAAGRVLEVWASDTSATYTVMVTTPQGYACVLSSGGSFELIPARAEAL